ncbi:STAS domain-containing protein [Halioxenophilus aromaticivorans]|uniref:Anti-anti sigma factor HsbA n=1 Tax=Halioxenophilus aromaticivorans TaxID=1306992 RepID=A0AAV3TZP8_9ALTE
MAVSAKIDVPDQSLVISIIGRFDFSSHNDFRSAYESLDPLPGNIRIDMKQASFIDSSALGMLLILRDFAGGNDANIAITHCNDEVRSILEVANFDDLFTIS